MCLDRGPTRPMESVKNRRITMKKLLAGLILTAVSATALAQPYFPHRGHGNWYRHPGGGWYWVPALIAGGIAGAVIARETQPPVIIEREPVVVVPPVPGTVCTEWKEIQTPDGKLYRERNCRQQ